MYAGERGIFETTGRGKEDGVVNRSVKRFTGIACRWWVKARVALEGLLTRP